MYIPALCIYIEDTYTLSWNTLYGSLSPVKLLVYNIYGSGLLATADTTSDCSCFTQYA